MTEQYSSKFSSSYSNLDTTDEVYKRNTFKSSGVDCQKTLFAFNEFPKKTESLENSNRKKELKRNILEEISSFDNSIDRDVDELSSQSEDEKNYDTLKNMLNDMDGFIGSFSHKTTAGLDEDYDRTSFSNFHNTKCFDEINDDDFSMKGFKPIYNGIEQSDILGKSIDNGYDALNFY